ncbi:MAG: tryptophan-rich sensory protein [Candidatus Bathyarchaeota archaeon]|nr:tryptophan-rich sensory protein [Candidatus Bathyarchaeota archaeon]
MSISSRKTVLLQVLNVAAYILTLVVNGLASAVALNGRTTAQVSDLYPTLVTPAGYVFSIWGVIYSLLLVFAVFQALPSQRENPFLGKISFLFVLSSFLNVFWLFLWHYDQIALSVVLMFALLATLIMIYLRLNIGKAAVTWKEKACVHLPFSVYLGWITVASIANVAAALVSVQWNGFGLASDLWGVLVIAVALLIALAVLATRKDAAYGLVLVWALVGIAVKQNAYPNIALATEASAIIIAIAVVAVTLFSRLKK